jgi:hypothetical protein
MSPIIAAIGSCSEWCQMMFLDAIARYTPASAEDPGSPDSDAEEFESVGRRKCIFLLVEFDGRNPASIFAQVIPPFITLIGSADAEIQYIVLRTLSLFVQKYRGRPRRRSKFFPQKQRTAAH